MKNVKREKMKRNLFIEINKLLTNTKAKTLAELKEYSCINLYNTSLKTMYNTIDDYKKNNNNIPGFLLDEGIINLSSSIILEKVENSDKYSQLTKDISVKIYFNIQENDNSMLINTEIFYHNVKNNTVFNVSNLKISINNGFFEITEDGKKTNKSMFADLLLSSLYYISIVQSNRNTVYKKTKGMTYKTTTTNNNNNNNNKLIKVQILNNDKILYTIEGKEKDIKHIKKYNHHIESWQVMGHFRTLKDGRKIWIKPYIKGNGRTSIKEYKVK